jgi:predicted nucleic acid-binding Zn ribbon protein
MTNDHSSKPSLMDKMRNVAKTQSPEVAARLTKLAGELDEKGKGFYADPQTVSVQNFVGAWARARRAYCEAIGEPLI